MSCRKARYWIQLELDGELTTRGKTRLASHLTACPSCREVRRQLGIMQAALRRMGEPAVAIGEGLPSVPVRRQGRGWLVAAAAVLAAGIGLWLMTDRLRAPRKIDTIVDVVPAPQQSQPVDPRTLVRIQLNSPQDGIVVPMPTRNPDVSIFWIYPTIKTAEVKPNAGEKKTSAS